MKNLIILSIALLMSACAVNQQGRVVPDTRALSKSTLVPLAGGLLGSVACYEIFKNHGSKAGWTAACGVGGYLLAQTYTQQSNRVLEHNRVGQSAQWSDPDGRHYTMTPTQTYYDGNTPCRSYRSSVEIDGRSEILTGQACRQADGSWRAI